MMARPLPEPRARGAAGGGGVWASATHVVISSAANWAKYVRGRNLCLTFAFFSPKVPVEKISRVEARPCP